MIIYLKNKLDYTGFYSFIRYFGNEISSHENTLVAILHKSINITKIIHDTNIQYSTYILFSAEIGELTAR